MSLLSPASRRRRALRTHLVEPLERRQLLSATLVMAPPAADGVSGNTQAVDLTNFIDDPALNTRIRMKTELGDMVIDLFDSEKPITVTNFLKYVRQSRYDTTLFHRSVNQGINVIQGGGYSQFTNFQHIDTSISGSGIQNEASLDPIKLNIRGSISMARTSDPNSGTSEFFINTQDNTALDPDAQPPGYAVFGQLTPESLPVMDAIQALPIVDIRNPQSNDPNDPFNSQGVYGEVPLRDYTQGSQPQLNNLVTITSARTEPTKLTFTASSSNPAVATTTVDGNILNLNYLAAGTTDITFTGTDHQGQSVMQTFTVTVSQNPQETITLGTGKPSSVTFTDTDGTVATLTYKGAGAATVKITGTGLTQTTAKSKVLLAGTASVVDSVAITGGSAAGAVTVTAKGGSGLIDLTNFTADSALKSISAKGVNLAGTMSVNGGVGKLDLGTATDATISIGGQPSDKPGAMTIAGAATGTNITYGTSLKSLKAASFAAGTQGNGQISAPIISTLTTTGDFVESLVLQGPIKSITIGGNLTGNIGADAIGSLTVRGSMTGANIASTRRVFPGDKPIGKVTVFGAMTNSVIRATGNIGTVTAGSIANSTVYAGVNSAIDANTLPKESGGFSDQSTISGVTSKSTSADVNVAAFHLGKISLGALTTANNGVDFGLSSADIASLTVTVSGNKLSFKKLKHQGDFTTQVGGVDLGDFKVILLF